MTTDPRREELLARRVADPEGASPEGDDFFEPDSLSPEDAGLYAQNRRVWKMSKATGVPGGPSVDDAWRRLSSRLAFGQARVARLRLLRFGSVAVAASVVVAAVLLWPKSDIRTESVAAGQQLTLNLADGTTVALNSGSTIEYFVTTSGATRQVALEGEAFFEVAPSTKPFVVRTPEATVTVLGTKFGVRSRDAATRVYVQSGRVDVSDGTSSVELGEMEVAERVAGAPVRRGETGASQAQFAWTSGGIAFVRTPIAEVLEELSRRSGRALSLGGENMVGRTVTATFPDFDLERILEAICLSLECSISVSD